MTRSLCLLLALSACSSDGAPPDDGPPEGYVRYRTSEIVLQPGESGLYAEWVAAPFDRDMDVEDVIGWQSAGGHHALMYSSSDLQPPGTTRPWEDADQLVSRFVGGVGGEGAAAVRLPPGVVFRVRAGSAMLIQTHYVNTGEEPITVSSYLDVKYVDPQPGALVASLFASTTLAIDVAPGESSLQIDCVLPEDVRILMYANHMHERGLTALTKLIDADGVTETEIKRDDAWVYEYAFNPNFGTASPQDPLVLPAGSTLRTECTWRNDGAANLIFPDEMCVFFGMFLAEQDVNCVDGDWQ
jgi:hypothetical protein